MGRHICMLPQIMAQFLNRFGFIDQLTCLHVTVSYSFFNEISQIVFALLSFLCYHYRSAVQPAMQLWEECVSLPG